MDRPWLNTESFVEGHCYKTHHLNWIRTHSQFLPEMAVWVPTPPITTTYHEVMTEVYSHPNYLQRWAFENLQRDIWYHRTLSEMNLKIVNQMLQASDSQKKYWFVTLGFNHQTFSVSKMLSFIENLMSYEWITEFKGKFEIYRSNGEHPHIHIIMAAEFPKSKIVEKIHACRGAKGLILAKNFIDVKPCLPCHKLYLDGIKQDSKMPYVEKDIEYRNLHGIPHMIIKS